MLKEIIYNNDSYIMKCVKIEQILRNKKDFFQLLKPDEFISDFLPFSIKVLEKVPPDKNSNSENNKCRFFILNIMNKISIEQFITQDLIDILNDVLEKDYMINTMLAIKCFALINRYTNQNEDTIEDHTNILLQLVNRIFGKLENSNDELIQESFMCLIELFIYISELNQRYAYLKKKIEIIIFKCVNFFISYLDEKKVMDMINFKKNISLVVISSISKLIKLISNTNVFISRNENYSNTILELSKFAIFYCPLNATEIRKELLYFIFVMILKTRDIYVSKIEELFDLRFFYSSEAHVTNIKGLIGLIDVLGSYSDHFGARIYFELLYRTEEVLYTSLSIISRYNENTDIQNLCKLEDLEKKGAVFLVEDDKFLIYEKSVKFHLEIVKELVSCINREMYYIYKGRLQKLEQIELSCNAFSLITRIIEGLEIFAKSTKEPRHLLLIKSIFISISKVCRDLTEKIQEFVQSTSETLISGYFKKDLFFRTFDASLDLLSILDFDDTEYQVIDDFILLFCSPFEFIFNDLNREFSTKLVKLSHKKIFSFQIIKKMASTTVGQYYGISNYLNLLKNILTQDFVSSVINEDLKPVGNFSSKNRTNTFQEQSDLRKYNKHNFYNLYFDLIIERFCRDGFNFTQQDTENVLKCLDILVKSNVQDMHEILLLCFKSLNNLKENINVFQMHFFKNFKDYVEIFINFHTLEKNNLYLDLIFSIPINLNLILADWEILILPIIESLKNRSEVTIKALNYLLYLIDNTKKETYSEKKENLLIELFKEVKSSLSNPKLSTYCAQILGRLKSFHKKYLYNNLYYEDGSFYRDQIYGISANQNIVSLDISEDSSPFKIQLHSLIEEILYYFRGSLKYSNAMRIRNHRLAIMFKKFDKVKLDNKKQLQAALDILSGFICSILGFSDYVKLDITPQLLKWWGELHKNINLIPKNIQDTNDDIYLSELCNLSYFSQLKKSQYLYDSIQALYACEGTFLESKATSLLKCISEVSNNFWMARRLKWPKAKFIIYFNHFLVYRAFLEGFEFNDKKMPIVLLHDLLTRTFEFSGSVDNFLKLGILQFIFKQIIKLSESSNERKKRAGVNAICGLIIWDYLPMTWVRKELLSIFNQILKYIRYSKGDYTKITITFDCLLDLLILNGIESSVNVLYSPLINFLMSKDELERSFAKKCLKKLKRKFKDIEQISVYHESVKLFLKDIGLKKDLEDIYMRLDVFVFILKAFLFFLGNAEIKGFVKMFYYYLKHFKAFEIPPNSFFQTDVSVIYSSDFIEYQNNILKSRDFIYSLYYDDDEKSYTKYLKYETAFLYLAYCNNKVNGKLSFDFIFSTLPKGLVLPLLKFEEANNTVVETIVKTKYEELLSELLSVDTIKKMISILLILSKFKDERLVAFIEKIFLEFRTHREICIFTESEENSILIKTFELSLLYPDQEQLYDKVILMVYTLLFEFSRSYIKKIEKRFLEYLETYSNLTYPLIVMNITSNPILYLSEILYKKVDSFRKYINNLKVSGNKLGLVAISSLDEDNVKKMLNNLEISNVLDIKNEDELKIMIDNLDISNTVDIEKGINLLRFLKLIEYEISHTQIQLALMIFSELKKTNKTTDSIIEYFKYSINNFSDDDLEVIFKIDPLFRIYDSVKVKTFAKLRNKSVMGCLLKSLSRADVSNYEKLIDYFGEHSWMLIEIFVEEKFYNSKMSRYCNENINNINIRSCLLYYLCTFQPRQEYFSMLLDLSHEERKYTLYCLKKIVEQNNDSDNSIYEKDILKYIRLESKYISNIFILYPLLISKPDLLTSDIVMELVLVVYRLFNTSIQLYYKTGTYLFDIICGFYTKNQVNIYENEILIDFYSKIVSYYNNLQKTNDASDIFMDIFKKYDFDINLDLLEFNNVNIHNMIRYLEIKSKNNEDTKNIEHIKKLIPSYISIIKPYLYNIQISKELVKYIREHINLSEDTKYEKSLIYHILEVQFNNDEVEIDHEKIYEIFKDELDMKYNLNPDGQYYFNKILKMMTDKGNVHKILSFITKILKNYNNNSLDISEVIGSVLIEDLSINDTMTMYSIIYNKLKEGIFIIKQNDFLNCALNFFLANKNVKIHSLSNLSMIFYYGLINKKSEIRLRYFQLFDEMISRNLNIRFLELLNLDWSFTDEYYIPYIIARMLLIPLGDVDLSTFRLFGAGVSKSSFYFDESLEKIPFEYIEETYKTYVEKYIVNFHDFVQQYSPCNQLSNILDFIYHSYDSCINILESIILNLELPNSPKDNTSDIEDIANRIFILVSHINNNEKISLLFLRYLSRHNYFDNIENIKKSIKYLRNGPSCWAFYAELKDSKTLYDMCMKDYYYGSLRAYSKLPELSKATLYHQLGKIKEAQQIYEEFQTKAIESKMSYYKDEYDLVLDEWIKCAKELQQWDLTLNIGRKKRDVILIADSMFYTNNFNNVHEREIFSNFIRVESGFNNLSNNPEWLFYELFIMLFDNFSIEKAVSLIKEINKKILFGPNSVFHDNSYMIFLQIIFEMHEISFIFNNSLENSDKINSILFRWEDREPNFENDFLSLLKFSTWRKHAYRKIEDFSNDLTFSDLSVLDNDLSGIKGDIKNDISGIVNKNKEYTETIKQLKKSMYFKGNNGLGKNSNYLGLASLRKGYFDNALFSFKSVFDLPSIKVLDAYHKVIYELMCFYEMKEYKLGLDLANSTNVSHFLDSQSSNLFRMRGLFSEKLGLYEEAEKLYFQSIHLSNIGENYYHYIRILIRNNHTNSSKDTSTSFLDDEIICSILMGLSCAELETSHNIMIIFINVLSSRVINTEMDLFINLMNNCNVNTFVFYISKLVELIHTDNYKYISQILSKIFEVYPQPVIFYMNLFLETTKKIPDNIIYNRALSILEDLNNIMNINNTNLVLSKFINVVDYRAFKNESSIIQILDSIISDIITFNYDQRDLKSKFIDLFQSMKRQIHTLLPFMSLFTNLEETLVFCSYKLLEILLLMRQKITLLLSGTEDNYNIDLRVRYNDFLVRGNIKKYLFGGYNEIRHDYKNIPYIEVVTTVISYCNRQYEKIEDLTFVCSDGKSYKYEFYQISKKETNLTHIYNLLSYKMSNNYEINIREGYFPLLKNVQAKEDMFINVVEDSYTDLDFIYEEYRIRNNLEHVILEYIKELEINTHQHTINVINDSTNFMDYSKDDIKEDSTNCMDYSKEDSTNIKEITNTINTINTINIQDKNKNIKEDTNRMLNLDFYNNFVFSNLEIINKEDPRIHDILQGKFEICKFTPKLSNKTKLKAFTNILKNNVTEDILKKHFKSSFSCPYKYLLFRNSLISSYSSHFIVSYMLHTINMRPSNIMIYSDKGMYINKKIFNTEIMNETYNLKIYISPNIQHFFGKEGIEGQFLSLIYHSFKDLEDFTEEILEVYTNLNKEKRKKIKERIIKTRNIEDIIKTINEWTSVENMSKINLEEYAWL
ncbi:uncharacterized protein VNE69_05078 [Vairimorpha necatrix]|uniref:PIK-related kinase FAT domain-containing protein n=1 Tax=Vairimorpha necatrix TaxID=6039 RepID=A0AAX4JBZ0_9MICR